MIQSNKRDIPAYVYRFVKIHVTTLIRTSYFNFDEKDDLTHELLLFYLDKFFCLEQSPPEELIFIALKRECGHILRSRFRFLKSGGNKHITLDELDMGGIVLSDDVSLEQIENQIAMKETINKSYSKEAKIIEMLMQGYSVREISKELHVSFSTISMLYKKDEKF